MKSLLALLFLAVFVSSCTVVSYQQQQVPEKTQLQVREYQTRTFDTNDTKLIMKAVLNVLQDDGFVVKNAVTDLGLLTASKEIDLTRSKKSGNDFNWADFFESMSQNRSNKNQPQTFSKLKTIEVSVNVSEYGRQSKVRANFQAKILDNNGNTVESYQVEDMKFYQDFFSKVDKGIFIQRQGL